MGYQISKAIAPRASSMMKWVAKKSQKTSNHLSHQFSNKPQQVSAIWVLNQAAAAHSEDSDDFNLNFCSEDQKVSAFL